MLRKSWPVIGVLVAAVAFVLDRLSKYILIEKVMRQPGEIETPFFDAPIIELLPVFNVRMAWNYGISFSLFDSAGSRTMIFALIAAQSIITIGLIWYMWQLKDRWVQIAVGLMIGGALGNILDRLIFEGAVADFFDFHVADWHFATFNVADSCISVGVVLWLLDAIRSTSHHAPAPDGSVSGQPKD